MLEFLRNPPEGGEDGAPVAVLLHGRGSHMGDLQSLTRILPGGGVLVTPQAPHPGGPWGYGPGWAWYRYLGEDRAEVASLTSSLEALDSFLGELPGRLGFRPGPLVLGGFSQGGTMSLAYALTHPGRVAGVVSLSGFLMNEADLGVGPEALGDTPFFWAHGTRDPAVPHALALRGRKRILEAGGRVEARDYPMGHWVNAQEVEELAAWLNQAVPGWK